MLSSLPRHSESKAKSSNLRFGILLVKRGAITFGLRVQVDFEICDRSMTPFSLSNLVICKTIFICKSEYEKLLAFKGRDKLFLWTRTSWTLA
ncbi:hypothetical protein IGI04_027648 [Brassica rapa subsp. trilocularis]|uniref:Uncharacterized protein n=1 Tax=Brassica rapa subsp. trilocularis TaxID=1813537 RepID=A0ABQ7L3G1_BRACM|nr:hypothetical protein IGI04_027648 [Brassica rapa subsp. trilocularis]